MSSTEEPAPGPPDTGPVRNTLLQLVAQLTAAGFTAVLVVFLVRKLGPSQYGTFAVALSVGLLVLLPSDFGLPAAVARFVAERREDSRAVSDMLMRGVQLKLAATAVGSLGLGALAVPIAGLYGDPRLVWPLRWIAVAIAGQGFVGYFSSVFAALRNVALSLRMIAAESVAETGFSICFVLLGTGPAGAALGRAVGYLVGATVGLLLARRLTGPLTRAWRRARNVPPGPLLRYARPMLVIDAAHTAIVQIDVLLIGLVLSVPAAGRFGAITRLFTFLTYLGNSVSSGVAPRLARSARSEPDARSFGYGLRAVIVIQGVLIGPLVAWASPLVGLVLGSAYGGSAPVMRALAPMAILAAVAPVLALGVNFLGEARRRAPIMVGTLGLGVASTYVLLKTVGPVGAAIADDIVFAVHVALHLWIARRMIELNVVDLGVTLARTMLACAAMAAVLVAVGTSHLTPTQAAVGLLLGSLSYGAVLLVTREITGRELILLRGTIVSRLNRASTS